MYNTVQYIMYSALYSTVDIYIVKRVHSTVYNVQCIIQYSGYICSEESTQYIIYSVLYSTVDIYIVKRVHSI